MLRHAETPAERRIWRHLRGRGLASLKVRRQHAVGRYVLDFYLPELRLGIELDGGGHAEPRQDAADSARTAWLEARGIAVRRYWNHDVLERTSEVLADLLRVTELRRRELAQDRDQERGIGGGS